MGRSGALRRGGAVIAVAAAIGLGAGALGAGAADAAVVTGRVANVAGGCLENAGNVTTEGNKIQLAACGNGLGQQWSRYSDGTLRVQGKCADTKGGATAQDTAVVLTTCSTSTSQKWTVRTDGRLLNQKANRCLQPYRAYIVAANAATIATCTTSNAQRWAVPALSTTAATTTPPAPTTTTKPPTTTTPPAPTTTTKPPTTTTPPTTTVPPTTTTPPTTTVPPTTSTPPTTTTPPQPTGTQNWSSAFTTSGVSRFKSTPWNNVGAQAPVLVNSVTRPGEKALQFTVPGGGNRSEVEPNVPNFTEGADLWFGMSVTMPADFPINTVSWQLITQWKNDGTGSPPVEVTVGKGNIWLSGGYGHPTGPKMYAVPISAADTGRKVDLVFHIVFSRDPAKGKVDVWRDGALAINGFRPPGGTLYPNSASATPTGSLFSYWKMGLYRDTAIVEPAKYVIESVRFGTGYGAVAG